MGYDTGMLLRHDAVELTPESIIAARKELADNALACATAARNRSDVLQEGQFYVNDLSRYSVDQQRFANDCLAGRYDHTFTLLQRAYFLQTGISAALLP